MEIGTVRQVDIDSEMRAAYLDYAMSVIVSRALPDARDGLKPVHRRILYAMYDMGLRPETPYRKSARIVGEVLGKYHPHGDAAVYDAMVRLAQDFAMRYPLVDGQGNFGSIDGDAAAAMRYTEARMQSLGADMLRDIDMETVEFVGNFDDSLSEPTVLPSSFPNLIVNGSSGIAVGMSTSVPPHNLAEVCDALGYMLAHWDQLDDIGLPDLMQFIKGPDFPTGGLLFRNSEDGTDNLSQAYATGRGKLVVQAKAHVEQLSRARNRLIITELPYQINKTSLLERIAELVRDNRIEGITDLRDESDRNGLRIVIDLTRTVEPNDVLRALYRLTPMRTTFSVIMLALVDNEPRMLTLKQALRVYLEHRFVVVRRRSEYELGRARERAHILQGLLIALGHLDEVIKLIRASASAEAANQALQQTYNLTEIQATAILNMPLRRLAALERRKIEEEYADLVNRIAYLEELLNSDALIREVVRDELTHIRSQYADPRRTLIVDAAAGSALSVAELMPDEKLWITVTESGLVSRTFTDEAPRITAQTRDAPVAMLFAGSSDTLYLFSPDGLAATVPVHQLPQSEDIGEGVHFGDVSGMRRDARIVAAVTRSPDMDQGFLTLVAVDGMVKRIELEELPGISANAFPVMGLDEGAELRWASWTFGGQELVLVSAQGKAIRFSEDEIRPMGLRAGGVKGMKIEEQGDRIVGFGLFAPDAFVWTMTDVGLVKRSPASDYPLQGRYGQGVITYKLGGKGELGVAVVAGPEDQVIVTTAKGKPRAFKLSGTPLQGRNTSGVSAMPVSGTDTVARAFVLSKRVNGPAESLAHPAPEGESATESAPLEDE